MIIMSVAQETLELELDVSVSMPHQVTIVAPRPSALLLSMAQLIHAL